MYTDLTFNKLFMLTRFSTKPTIHARSHLLEVFSYIKLHLTSIYHETRPNHAIFIMISIKMLRLIKDQIKQAL